MRLTLCCLFGLVLTLVSAVPPENCPDDYDSICRTDYRYRVSHDWIPYANASSGDGIRWRVLVDQHDYQNIFGPFFFPAGKWKALDADGDGITWVHGSGGTCTYQVRVNSYRRPGSNNWYFTQALSYCDAEELIVNASVRFSSCTQRPDCIHDYVYLHRFDTNSPNENERIKPENYNYYLENEEDSKLKQEGTTSDTEIIEYFRRPDTTHTYFGIQDIGTTGQVQRFMVYYKVCQKNQAGLTIYPEVPLPPHTSGPNDRIMRLARCVAHAHNVTSLETYAYKDRCVQNVQCDCDPGYEQSADSTACMPCAKGYYKTSLNSTCVLCPKNSNSDEDGADQCECIDGYYRAPNEGVGMMCTAPPDPIPNKLRIVSMCDTTAELQWDRPGEVGRDDFYYAINRTNPDTSEETMINTKYINNSTVITFKITGLAPKTTYTFSVCVHNGVSQFDQINDKLRLVAQQATTRQGSVFMHNNMELSNNSVVLMEEIGEGEKALICQTLSDEQCGGSESLAMFFPNSTQVLPAGNGRTVYSTTEDGQVRLNRKLEDDSPLGSYYCQIPDRAGNIRKMFIRIATIQLSGGAPTCLPTTTQQPTPPPTTTQQPIPPPTTTQQPIPPPTQTGLRIELNGNIYTNGSTVYIDDIGEDSNALICHTSRPDCCSIIGSRHGEFYYPNGNKVGIRTKNEAMYRNRGPQLIRLNRNSGSLSIPPMGWYRCEIPTESGEQQSISFNIAARPGELPVECPQLSDIIGGSVTVNADVIVPGSKAMYSCDDNHRLSGSSVRECQEDGTWSGSEPTCEVIVCPALTSPDNGNVNQLGNTPGGLAIYACNDNFQLSGEMSRECGPDGQWTGEAPLCEVICPSLEHPGNGLVMPEGNSPGSVATYSCNGGHSLLGSATSQCQSNGAWSNQPPICSKVGFQLNGQFHASGSSLFLSSVREGDSALLCVTDGSCCTPPNRFGEFYYPNNTPVRTEGSGDDFYRDRGNQMIRLNRRNGATSPTGMYKCAIPDSNGVTQEIFITLN